MNLLFAIWKYVAPRGACAEITIQTFRQHTKKPPEGILVELAKSPQIPSSGFRYMYNALLLSGLYTPP